MRATRPPALGDVPTDPAAPGTYGEPPLGGVRLPNDTRLGPVRLRVSDLGRSVAFYERTLGLRVAEQGSAHASLTAPGTDAADTRAPVLLTLDAAELAGRPAARRLGLYHVAYLLPDRASLVAAARHLAHLGVLSGASDHGVSEALYLADPDGLGIELYADRPRDTWRRVGRELAMGTDAIDLRDAPDTPWTGMPAGTVVGHVHLHVGALDAAAAFYADALGFDRTVWGYPGALFLSAGGYHHHLGVNTWAGPRAEAPRDDEARLLAWTLGLPTTADVVAAGGRLAAAGYAVEEGRHGALARDPWGTALRLQSAPSGER